MPKRSSNKKDENETAFDILQKATSEQSTESAQETSQKNPAAVALGRLGGLKGGKARAKALSAKRRREIAKNAAKKRWQKRG